MSGLTAEQIVPWAPKQSIPWTCLCVAFNLSYPAALTWVHCFERENISHSYCLLYKRLCTGGGSFEGLDDSQVGTPIRCSPVVQMFVRPSGERIFSCVMGIKLQRLNMLTERKIFFFCVWLTNAIMLKWVETSVKLAWNWQTDPAFVVENQVLLRLYKAACLGEVN